MLNLLLEIAGVLVCQVPLHFQVTDGLLKLQPDLVARRDRARLPLVLDPDDFGHVRCECRQIRRGGIAVFQGIKRLGQLVAAAVRSEPLVFLMIFQQRFAGFAAASL